MKVLLVNPSVFIQGVTATRLMEQLFYISSYLHRRNPEIEVEILDLTLEIGQPRNADEIKVFLAEAELLIKRTGFDLVGISCWTSHNYPSAVEIANMCRRLNPECTIVVGGYHPTAMPQDFRYPGSPFDYVVQGEGEVAFWQIATGQVPKENHPQVVNGPNLPMDEPLLDWDAYKYHHNFEMVTVWLTRGCPFPCTFCHDRLTAWRSYPPQQALEELKAIKRTLPRVKTVFISDPLFGVNKEWRRDFLRRLIAADLDLSYWAETRVDILEEEDIELFSRLRFRIDFGLESVIPRLLTIMKKTSNPTRYLEGFRAIDKWMTDRKMVRTYNHIYNYPGETTETLRESIKFWRNYFGAFKDGECYAYVGPFIFMLFPGNDLWNNWAQYEAEYGCRALCPEWWKRPYDKLQDLSGDIIASRELAESHNIHLHKQVALEIMSLGNAKINHADFGRFKIPPPPLGWADAVLLADKREAYFDDKPLQMPHRVIRHQKVRGNELLYDFQTDLYFNCSRATGELVRAVLDEGKTIDELALARAEIYGDPLVQRARIRETVIELLSRGMLELGIPRPPSEPLPPGEYRVRLRTNLGDLDAELFAAEAPAAVANFLHLIRWKYYDSLLFQHVFRQSAFVQAGDYTVLEDGPGYVLDFADSGRPARRGALVMDRQDSSALHGQRLQAIKAGLGIQPALEPEDRGPILTPQGAIHGSRFRILRIDRPAWDGQELVFGRLLAGWETLDRLVAGDRILSIELVSAPPAWESTGAASGARGGSGPG